MKVGNLYFLKDCESFIVLITSFETTNYNTPSGFVQYYCFSSKCFSSKELYACHGSYTFNQYYELLC